MSKRTSAVGSFLRRVGAGMGVVRKDFGVSAEGDVGWHRVAGGSSVHYPGSDLDWEGEAGELWLNAAVAICLQYCFDKVAEPRVRAVYEGADQTLQPIKDHPAIQLLNWANGEYRGRQLLAALTLSYKLNGNAYAIKVRGGGGLGAPRELWYVPHWRMTPLPPADGGETQFYKLTFPGSTESKLYARADVVHHRNGLDPTNPRLGMSPFRAQLRGIVSDNEIDTYTAIILRNMGVDGGIISPTGEVEFTPAQAKALKERIAASRSGDSRGEVLVPSVPIKVDRLGRSPQEMALTTIGDRPQARICAAFGIDPAAVGLLSGSGKGEKYGSMRQEARSSSYEQGILPMLSVFAEGWTQELLPDFVGAGNAAQQDVWIEYDYSKVKDLQEDADAVHKRAQDDFKSGLTTLDEGRSDIGKKPAADAELGEKYYFQLMPAPAGEYGVPPTEDDPAAPPEGTPPSKDDTDLPNEDDEEE